MNGHRAADRAAELETYILTAKAGTARETPMPEYT
jgi:hypothetical protein